MTPKDRAKQPYSRRRKTANQVKSLARRISTNSICKSLPRQPTSAHCPTVKLKINTMPSLVRRRAEKEVLKNVLDVNAVPTPTPFSPSFARSSAFARAPEGSGRLPTRPEYSFSFGRYRAIWAGGTICSVGSIAAVSEEVNRSPSISRCAVGKLH